MKDATPEQLKTFHHRCNVTVITNLSVGAAWILGLAWLFMNNTFNITAAAPEVLIGSGIVVYGIQVYFQFLYFRCPACEQPFPPFSRYLPENCQKCETNFAVSDPTFPTLAKTLRALSLLLLLLAALRIIFPLVNGQRWSSSDLFYAMAPALISAVLFNCYQFSLHGKLKMQTTILLWCVVSAVGIYVLIFLFNLLGPLLQNQK
jgi:hypothetical protein